MPNRRTSSVLVMQLRLFSIKTSICARRMWCQIHSKIFKWQYEQDDAAQNVVEGSFNTRLDAQQYPNGLKVCICICINKGIDALDISGRIDFSRVFEYFINSWLMHVPVMSALHPLLSGDYFNTFDWD